MEDRGWQRVAWWWNRSWGHDTRRDVWLEFDAANLFRVRWRIGRADDSHQLCSLEQVIPLLKNILGEDRSGWQETVYLDEHGILWRYDKPLEKVNPDDG